MNVGVFTALLRQQPLGTALKYIKNLGLDTVELGTGNYVGGPHCSLDMLEDGKKLDEFKKVIEDNGITISALSCHGNSLHPQDQIASEHSETNRRTILLAEKLGVNRVVDFSGCPGDSEDSKYPNWVVCPWPTDFLTILEWQWNEKIIPFWKERGKIAAEHGVKICIEMHPGFPVHSTETLLRLREEVGPVIGANFDPSHLFWQGIDPIASIRKLGEAVFHVHAKDTRIYEANCSLNGVLDKKSYRDEANRSWIFRTVGYGHGPEFWKDFVSTLRMVGYDDVLSIEHEDSLMSVNEGFSKAVQFLNEIILKENTGEMWWA